MKRTMWAIALASTGLLACGGGDDDGDDDTMTADARPPGPDAATNQPDAMPSPDAGPETDAMPMESAACQEFGTPDGTISTYPGTFSGDVNTGSTLVDIAQGDCATENAPFGVVAPGPEQVIRLENLVAGTTYLVNLSGAYDMAFYVATSCTGDDGPAAGECLAYVDASAGTTEAGQFTQPTFIAPADGVAYLIVDYWDDSAPPTDGTFTAEVQEAECMIDADCTEAGTPRCNAGICVECLTNFDCATAENPVCGSATANACGPGFAMCTGDDATPPEEGDDGPGGATDITPTALPGTNTGTAHICDTPAAEADFYSFTLTETSDVTFTLAWTGENDLDLYLMDPTGVSLGLSWYVQPEVVTVTHLAPGTYYILIDEFGGSGAAALEYTWTIDVAAGTDCTADADCGDATDFSTQVPRLHCNTTSGACEFVDGMGTVAAGGLCDSTDDCDAMMSLGCYAPIFGSDLADDAFCTVTCAADADCTTALGEGYICHTGGGFCVKPCTADTECGADTGSFTPDTDLPWDYLTCNTTDRKSVV